MRILLLLLLSSAFAFGQQKNRIFEKIDVDKGLSSNWVKDIVQDKTGYIWMATSDGLNRYDGYTIKSYNHSDENLKSILVNNILCLFVDSENLLWLGYNGGISKFDPIADGFIHFANNPNNANSISSNKVTDITSDSKGDLWITTRDKGLCHLNKSTYNFTSYISKANSLNNNQYILKCDKKDRIWIGTFTNGVVVFDIATKTFREIKKGLPDNVISALFEDEEGTIWVGTGKSGLFYYNEKKDEFVKQQNLTIGQRILSINEDFEGNLWIVEENRGLYILSKNKEKFTNIKSNRYITNGIGHNSINTILRDNSDNMWLGTFSSGVNLYKVPNNKFGHIFNDPINQNTLSDNAVLCFAEDSDKNLWIGTDDGGLNKYNTKTEKFELIEKGKSLGSISSNVILSLKEDKNKNLWVATYADGLFFREKSTGKFSLKIPNISFGSISEDNKGNLWLGSWGQGLYRYNPKTGNIKIYNTSESNHSNIGDDFLYYVYIDRNNKIWACTSIGLSKLEDEETGKFRRFINDKGNPKSLGGNTVYHCYEDSKRRIWVGTDGGLSILNKDSLKFVTYKEADGFENSNILGILEDNEGNLWLSTNKGLSKFNPETKTIKNYNKSDGLQNNQFSLKAQLKLSTGELLFGGTNGYNRFTPADVKENTKAPVVLIKRVDAIENLTNETIVHLPSKEIQLGNNVTNLIFNFVAFNYNNTEKVIYAYMLEGFDKDWTYIKYPNPVNYTNLNAGTYTFKVKASNENGVWNEQGASVKVIIETPFYYSKWFLGLVVSVLIFGSWIIFKKYSKK